MGHAFSVLALLAALSSSVLSHADPVMLQTQTAYDNLGDNRRFMSTDAASGKADEEDRTFSEFVAKVADGGKVEEWHNERKDFQPLLNGMSDSGTPLFENPDLPSFFKYVHDHGDYQDPNAMIGEMLVSSVGNLKAAKMLEKAKKNPAQQELAQIIENSLFAYWRRSPDNLKQRFETLKPKKFSKEDVGDQLFKESGLKTLIDYAIKLRQLKESQTPSAIIDGQSAEKKGLHDVVLLLISQRGYSDLSEQIEMGLKNSETVEVAKLIQEGLFDSWKQTPFKQLFKHFDLKKNHNDLFSRPAMYTLVKFAVEKERKNDFVSFLGGAKGLTEKIQKNQSENNIEAVVNSLREWDVSPENKKKSFISGFLTTTTNPRPLSSDRTPLNKVIPTTPNLQPISSGETLLAPITSNLQQVSSGKSFPDKITPATSKMQPASSGEDLAIPASSISELNSASSVPHGAPFGPLKQQEPSSEAMTLPANSKLELMPPDAPKSSTFLAKIRRILSAVWAKLRALLWPFN
ncbi:uncharacterized protein PHALS_08450 [Plasmopara halstedii]|uniref:RxLR-like protein n=1 Tax=Plasmopara halstedii TaxID=4781 RepID=A0A0N7L4D5_PLAHL|nr:uncharacterized protein PHALS_08450 [Plasmopara halstedii]CEG38371.1 hypothetical protein PHALS_08450 [Plasmopara halstedii]|eukprot:XP_024574740.1 hypothetical protein PHALS_08450 [Plasmopara halstedii]